MLEKLQEIVRARAWASRCRRRNDSWVRGRRRGGEHRQTQVIAELRKEAPINRFLSVPHPVWGIWCDRSMIH